MIESRILAVRKSYDTTWTLKQNVRGRAFRQPSNWVASARARKQCTRVVVVYSYATNIINILRGSVCETVPFASNVVRCYLISRRNAAARGQ